METQVLETQVADAPVTEPQALDQSLSPEEQTKEMIAERLDRLPLRQLQQVLTFADFILYQQSGSPAEPAPATTMRNALPATDAFVHLAGSWQFEPGELEEIMQDIEQGRLMELEQEDVLFD